jgi:hypothetical protein
MQTMEQALADLTVRRVVKLEDALTRSSRPEQLVGILERQGYDVNGAMATLQMQAAQQPVGAGLRVAGS